MKIAATTRKVFGILVLVGLIGGGGALWYVFFKPHRNVSTEKPAYIISTKDLSAAFKTDTSSLSKYIDKAMEVEGVITAIDGSHLSFENVTCNVDSASLAAMGKYKVGSTAKLQGRLTTYNDLMEEILLDQCALK